MHALKAIAEKVCKKKTPPKQSNVGFLSRQKMNQSFVSFGYYLAGYGGKSPPAEHEPTGQKPKSVQKPTDFFFSLSLSLAFICYVVIRAYYTWASLSSSLHTLPSELTSRPYSTPHKTAVFASLCHIQHHTRWQSLPLSHTHRHSTVRQCLYLCTNLTFT